MTNYDPTADCNCGHGPCHKHGTKPYLYVCEKEGCNNRPAVKQYDGSYRCARHTKCPRLDRPKYIIGERRISDHEAAIAKGCVAEARKAWGDGWGRLSLEQQHGAVAIRLNKIVMTQHVYVGDNNTTASVVVDFLQNVIAAANAIVEGEV